MKNGDKISITSDQKLEIDSSLSYDEGIGNGKDPDLKAFAAKTLPVMLMHLDSAKSISEAIKR